MTLYRATAQGNVPMSAQEEADFLAAQAAAQTAAIPRAVTMRQARLALLAAGKLAAVQPAIDALSSPQREQAQIEWEYSSEVHRDRPLVQMLAQALSLDLDALFADAAAR